MDWNSLVEKQNWIVRKPQEICIDDPIVELRVDLCGGQLLVSGTAGPSSKLEFFTSLGEPVHVRKKHGILTVSHSRWRWMVGATRRARERKAAMSLSVPEGVRVKVNAFSATTAVAGISGGARLRGMHGSFAVSDVTGGLDAFTKNGDLNVSAVDGPKVRVWTVRGDVKFRVGHVTPQARIIVSSQSGDVCIEAMEDADLEVSAFTTSGNIYNGFARLKKATGCGLRCEAAFAMGRLGAGSSTLKAMTTDGNITLSNIGSSAKTVAADVR